MEIQVWLILLSAFTEVRLIKSTLKEAWDDRVSGKDGMFDQIYKSGFSCSGRSLKKLQKASMERLAVYGEYKKQNPE